VVIVIYNLLEVEEERQRFKNKVEKKLVAASGALSL
jgi:hypothetical protein